MASQEPGLLVTQERKLAIIMTTWYTHGRSDRARDRDEADEFLGLNVYDRGEQQTEILEMSAEARRGEAGP